MINLFRRRPPPPPVCPCPVWNSVCKKESRLTFSSRLCRCRRGLHFKTLSLSGLSVFVVGARLSFKTFFLSLSFGRSKCAEMTWPESLTEREREIRSQGRSKVWNEVLLRLLLPEKLSVRSSSFLEFENWSVRFKGERERERVIISSSRASSSRLWTMSRLFNNTQKRNEFGIEKEDYHDSLAPTTPPPPTSYPKKESVCVCKREREREKIFLGGSKPTFRFGLSRRIERGERWSGDASRQPANDARPDRFYLHVDSQ